jgi:transposase DDE domain
MKAQIAVDEKDMRILNVSFSHGSVHDFKLFCKSRVHFLKDVLLIADKGYTGMNKIHSNSLIPKKSTKKGKLTKEDRKYNSAVSKRRIYIEHVNRHIKKFRIVSTRYRNKRRKFSMRFSLICTIYNFEL